MFFNEESENLKNSKSEEGIKEGCIHNEFEELGEVLNIIAKIPECIKNNVIKEKCDEAFTKIVDEYLEQPHLLDPHLDMLLRKLISYILKKNSLKLESDVAFRYLYLICKVRGYKNITKKFPHEVNDIEPVLNLLSKQTTKDPWETRYILLIWLSMICLIPFDMNLFDNPSELIKGLEPISVKIIKLGKRYLVTSSDNSQEAAAVMLAKLHIRPDISSKYLESLINWCISEIIHNGSNELKGIIVVKGCLRCLALLFKFGKREELIPLSALVLQTLENCKFLRNETVLRKLSVKVAQRVGMTLLKPRVTAWRYQRGSRCLDSTLIGEIAISKNISKSTNKKDVDEEFEVPDTIDSVLEILLIGLKDKDTVVRWSSAKGVGRITGRLPKDFADDVLEHLLKNFTTTENEGAWHGSCLALAELGRRGLLLPERLHQVVPVLIKTLLYEERRGASSVGSNVRDAGCYLAWAFARAYEPEALKRYIQKIAQALLITAVFDREGNCRRAASAAFQENVGRQGSFPHGIEIVTMVDYFTVSNISNAYLKISPKLAAFGDYTNSFIYHLVDHRMNHWDKEIRWLAAKSVNKIVLFRPQLMAEEILERLIPLTTGLDSSTRHGSIIMIAEIVKALNEVETKTGNVSLLSKNRRLREVYRVVKSLKEAHMFKGLSGELMRSACSHLITCINKCSEIWNVPPTTNQSWAELLHDNLSHLHLFNNSEEICQLSISALSAMNSISMTSAPFANLASLNPENSRLKSCTDSSIDQYLCFLQSDNESKRCGYAQAIGSLPKPVLEECFDKVLRGLFKASQVNGPNDIAFAESRRDAINALNRACQTVGVCDEDSSANGIKKDNLKEIYELLFKALEDYTRDSRGDVGSYVRGATIHALHDITLKVVENKPELLTPEIVEKIMSLILRQACEKLHKIREVAIKNFVSLLHCQLLPHIPHFEELIKIFPTNSNLLKMAQLFKRFTQTLDLEKYSYQVLFGLLISVGDLTLSLAEASGNALIQYMSKNCKDVDKIEKIFINVLHILQSNSKNKRVTIPLLKVLNKLLVKNCFEALNTEHYRQVQLDLISQLKIEILRSKDAHKVLLSVPVFCNMISFENEEVRNKVISQMMVFLCHRFPIVRKTAATQLYEQLLIYFDLITNEEHLETTNTYLLEIEWDQEDVLNLRPKRNEMCLFFNVSVPTIKSKQLTS